MSQIADVLKMLVILRNRGKIKISDLSKELEVSERSVRRYKEELEKVGYYIESDRGRYGGYFLPDETLLPALCISDEEYYSLLLVNSYLQETNHLAKKDIAYIIDKVEIFRKEKKLQVYTHLVQELTSLEETELGKIFMIKIREAILTTKKIKIKYTSLKNEITKRVIHPYLTYQHKGDMYVNGYCEIRNEFRDFKICRIQDIEVLKEKFEKQDMDTNKIMEDCIGVYRGKTYEVKLEILYPMSRIVSEKIWVKNQKITQMEEGKILFEAKMKGLPEIKTWVLGMGSSVKVLGDEELKEEIKREIKNIKNLYCD